MGKLYLFNVYTFCKSLRVINEGSPQGLHGDRIYILYLYDHMWLVGEVYPDETPRRVPEIRRQHHRAPLFCHGQYARNFFKMELTFNKQKSRHLNMNMVGRIWSASPSIIPVASYMHFAGNFNFSGGVYIKLHDTANTSKSRRSSIIIMNVQN